MARLIYSSIILFLLIGISTGSSIENHKIPEWLDTVAPQIVVSPDSMYHNSIFHISFSSNERCIVWYSLGTPYEMTQYVNPIMVSKEGITKVYYYGEDDFGNRSAIDSISYILDSRAPVLSVIPSPGVYPQPVTVRVTTDESCLLFYQESNTDQLISFTDSLLIRDHFEGTIIARDRAGNSSRTSHLKYFIDTSSFNMKIDPVGGIFNRSTVVTLSASEDITLFYSFDPLAPPEYFTKYEKPFSLPHGLTILRYFGKRKSGKQSEILKARYIVDTIAPKLQIKVSPGNKADTVHFFTREKSEIRYTLDRSLPDQNSSKYVGPVVIPHRGLSTVKARAWDEAGNQSEILNWEQKYDHTPPKIKISHDGGFYTRPLTIFFTSDEPVRIFYTLDGSSVKGTSPLYTNAGITISRNDTTILRYTGVDEAGNSTEEKTAIFVLDTRPPDVKIRIDRNVQDTAFTLNMFTNEPAAVYYTIDGSEPDTFSKIYTEPFTLRFGDKVKYMAIDRAGNRSQVKVMDDLQRPVILANPDGGVFNKKLRIAFVKNSRGTVFWRTSAEENFQKADDTLEIREDGTHILEYFLESEATLRSVVRRSVYRIDKTPPFVQVKLRKGVNDSVIVFFESSEPASIYYTTDNSDPLRSNTTQILGNKFNQTKDRIVIKREDDIKLAFYAEDAAGNQSAVSVLDVFKPRAVANVPSGADRVYNRILSITLNSYDQSTIYFERHGKIPTTASEVFSEPLTLMESDTIMAFVIDASGQRGDVDTFIYIIDLPPSPRFTISPDTVYKGMKVLFDPAGSLDKECIFENLKFRWDFDGDGVFDSDYTGYTIAAHTYYNCGMYKPVLEVMDNNGHKASISKTVLVRERCSEDMVSVIDSQGHAFCIDKYEWPNAAGVRPLIGVSWVEAKMNCTDAGKRLCTQKEWETACNSNVKTIYPYGDKYNKKRCPTEGRDVWKSGSFSECNRYGIEDMLGNAWEWVEKTDSQYRQMVGGSYLSGKDAYCGLTVEGTVATRSNETGFRCCK